MIIDVNDVEGGIVFSAEIMGAERAQAAPPAPLALLSHGNGGSYKIYRALCMALVDAGWIVAGFDHPGNNRRDDRLKGTRQNLEDRPRHLQLVLEAVLLRCNVDRARIAAIGHSLGSYTVLALAGAEGSTREGEPLVLAHDGRIGALVLLAPAAFWFTAPDALRAVTVPILILEGEFDDVTPASHGARVREGVADPGQVTAVVEPGAGHFSFITPFPVAMRRPGFAPANDPEGFDREAFHQRYPQQVLAFLERVLPRR